MTENEVSRAIYECAIEVHRTLGGPGLLEGVYEEALAWELGQKGLKVERRVQVPIQYKGRSLGTPMRLDMLVEGSVVVECKAAKEYAAIYESQALTYLRMSGLKLGMVINFGEKFVKDGIHRVVNGL